METTPTQLTSPSGTRITLPPAGSGRVVLPCEADVRIVKRKLAGYLRRARKRAERAVNDPRKSPREIAHILDRTARAVATALVNGVDRDWSEGFPDTFGECEWVCVAQTTAVRAVADARGRADGCTYLPEVDACLGVGPLA